MDTPEEKEYRKLREQGYTHQQARRIVLEVLIS